MAVPRIDAKLSVCSTEVFLENVTSCSFVTNDIEEGIDSWKAKGVRLIEVRVSGNAAIN